MTSEAIVIGVNHYEFLQPLKYAQQDALALKEFLETEAKFDRVYYFAEDAPMVNGMSMRPTRNNIRRVMRGTFAEPFMGDGDNFWFFFSGHGMRSGERDFLMPIDGDPDDVSESGISTAQVSEWLRGCGADNVVMVLDACRSGGMKDGKGIGDQTKKGCRQTGVISLFSCSPNQYSYELEAYQQGAFTKVLLEGLGVQGGCATVARLDEYLKRRVPEVVRSALGDRYNQMPYSIAEPMNKANLILMPQHSRPEDLTMLKNDAFRAANANDLRLAYQCWLRVNIASRGLDMEAIGEIVRLSPQVAGFKTQTKTSTPAKSQPTSEVPLGKGDLGGSKPTEKPIEDMDMGFAEIFEKFFSESENTASLKSGDRNLNLFKFETCQLSSEGVVFQQQTKTAPYFRQDLGNGVGIDMVAILGGKFRNIQIPEFFMSKTLITQAQWETVSKLPKFKIELKSNPSRVKGSKHLVEPKHPVERVNWWMAEEFCKRLSIVTKQNYVLPAEAQWEYACRSGTETKYYFGETLSSEVANYSNSIQETTEVEKYPANAWGLYDMHGNLWEWCADHCSPDFETALKDSNPIVSSNESAKRVMRGGSWINGPQRCASGFRYCGSPEVFNFSGGVGFRVACSSPRT